MAGESSGSNDMTTGSSDCPITDKHETTKITSHLPDAHLRNGNPTNTGREDPVTPAMLGCSTRMQELFEGLNEHGDCGNPVEPPPWLDKELFKEGRKFYSRYLFSVSFAETLSLVFMLNMMRSLRPLMYTSRSDSPRKALRRYFSTFQHVRIWHEGDVWNPDDPAHKDVLSVRGIHNKMSDCFNSSKEHEKVWQMTIHSKGHEEPKCPFFPTIREDVKNQTGKGLVLESPDNPPFFISQWDMSLTQYQFMGLMVAHPVKVGASAATDDELEALIHFWRGLGWLLGIDDKYNFCRGSLAEVRSLCLEVERLVGLPGLAKVDWSYEHMVDSLVSGLSYLMPTLSFQACFRFLAFLLDLDIPRFVARMSLLGTFQYWIMRFGIGLLYYFPGLIDRLSEGLKAKTEAIKRRYARGMNEEGGNATGELYPVMKSFPY